MSETADQRVAILLRAVEEAIHHLDMGQRPSAIVGYDPHEAALRTLLEARRHVVPPTCLIIGCTDAPEWELSSRPGDRRFVCRAHLVDHAGDRAVTVRRIENLTSARAAPPPD